jgi:gliding motility-associated-like protein
LHNGDVQNIQFVRPNQTRTFTVEISDLCLSQPGKASITVYVGVPDPASIEVAPNEACAETEVLVRISDFNALNTYVWYMGDSSVYADLKTDSLIHKYDTPGCYDIDIASTTAFGCYARTREVCAVKVLAQPIAAFVSDPAQPSNVDPILTIENRAIGADQFIWFIGEDTLYDVQSIVREFSEYEVPTNIRQVAISSDGCVDTLDKVIQFRYETLIYFPRAFTPNDDGLNDEFRIQGEAIALEDFSLKIFDRWGGLIFESKSIERGWNGLLPDGTRASQGVYPLMIRYRDELGELRTIEDMVIISSSGKKIPLR